MHFLTKDLSQVRALELISLACIEHGALYSSKLFSMHEQGTLTPTATKILSICALTAFVTGHGHISLTLHEGCETKLWGRGTMGWTTLPRHFARKWDNFKKWLLND